MSTISGLISSGGGGLTPKFQEFTSSGTFTPSSALIAAGGYIEVFLVGGGGRISSAAQGAAGGETILTQMYLTSTSNVSVIIAGTTTSTSNGGFSSFNGSTAGGVDVNANGGDSQGLQQDRMGAGWGGTGINPYSAAAGSGVLGYGAGGSGNWNGNPSGVWASKANSGQAGRVNTNGASGYCLVKWYE